MAAKSQHVDPRLSLAQARSGKHTTAPIVRLLPPQRVANSELVAPLLYTINETARLISASPRTVHRLIERGELTAVGYGRLKRVTLDSIMAFIERHRHERQ
jgi:excisionase family DNA binding protein